MLNSLLQNICDKLHSEMGRDAVWTFSCQIIVMVTLLVINKILSNGLSIEEFGQYNIIRRSGSVLSFVILGGMGVALPRYLPYFQKRKQFFSMRNTLISSLAYVAILACCTTLICVIFNEQLSTLIIGENSNALYFVVIFYSLSMALSSLIYGYYRGLSQFKPYNLSQLFLQFAMMLTIIVCFGINLKEMFILWTLLGLLFTIAIFLYESKKYRYVLFRRIDTFTLKENFIILSSYSLPRLISDFLLFSLNAFPLIWLGAKSSLTNASFFSIGVSLATMVSPVFSILGVILLPYVSKQVADGKLYESNIFIRKILIVYISIAVLIVAAFCIFMPIVIKIFFSDTYLVTTDSSRIISLSVIPSALYYLYRNPIDAASKVPYNTYVLLICVVVMLVLFSLSDSLIEYSWSFFIVMFIKGISSILSWKLILWRERIK